MTSGVRGTPHADALAATNPGLRAHVKTSLETGLEGWRNPDRNIRDWWLQNRATVETGRVLFLEYDVRAHLPLVTLFPNDGAFTGIEGCHLKMPVRDGRSWKPFEETDRLPRTLQSYAVGLAPLAILMICRKSLDAAADPGFDELFSRDIFSELRLPTVIRWAGFPCMENARLAHIGCGPLPHPGSATQGIWHAVKTGGEP